jgi:hypothetical protein
MLQMDALQHLSQGTGSRTDTGMCCHVCLYLLLLKLVFIPMVFNEASFSERFFATVGNIGKNRCHKFENN